LSTRPSRGVPQEVQSPSQNGRQKRRKKRRKPTFDLGLSRSTRSLHGRFQSTSNAGFSFSGYDGLDWTSISTTVSSSVNTSTGFFDFVRTNLPRMAAVIVSLDHLQDDLARSVARSKNCLRQNALLSVNKCIPLQDGSAVTKQLERCYIYKDATGGDWIRSEKVML
jgi:hypothetical protein